MKINDDTSVMLMVLQKSLVIRELQCFIIAKYCDRITSGKLLQIWYKKRIPFHFPPKQFFNYFRFYKYCNFLPIFEGHEALVINVLFS